MRHDKVTIVILLGCMVILWLMWHSLSREVQSGKPFQLEGKWYRATEEAP